MISRLKKFFRDVGGNIAMFTAVLAPALFGTAGITLDYVAMYNQSTKLQDAADSAALASVKEVGLAGSASDKIQAIAKSYATATFYGGDATKDDGGLSVVATASKEDGEVKVDLSYTWTPFLAHIIDAKVMPIQVSATAQLAGEGEICVLGLSPDLPATIELTDKAKIKAKLCAVYANSNRSEAIQANTTGFIQSSMTCSSGGVTGPSAAFKPSPITDCPRIPDPLLDRPEPAFGSCDHMALEIDDEDKTLTPGVYCGGLKISGDSEVEFTPGTYVITGGKFLVQDKAEIEATGVGFFMADDTAIFEFDEDTTISLEAPETGPLAGILFFDHHEATPGRKHVIKSGDAQNLLGTFYLPNSTLLVDAGGYVAKKSAFTVVIAWTVEVLGKSKLELNSNYSDTDVPVPDGLSGRRIVLKH